METKNALRAARNALVAFKSWGRKGRKGYFKAWAHKAARRAAKAFCRDN